MGSDPSGNSAKVAMGHTQKTLKCTHIYTKYYYPYSHVTQTAAHPSWSEKTHGDTRAVFEHAEVE